MSCRPSSHHIVHHHVYSPVICCDALVLSHHPLKWQRGRAGLPLPFPSAHSEGEGNMAMVTRASPPVDIMAHPEGTIDVPSSHRDMALS
jgi:hypothetical protein